MPGNFGLDATHCEFCLVGAGYFYIPINILDTYPGMQLNYSEKV